MKKIIIIILMFCLTRTIFADLTATEGLSIDLSSAGAGTDFTIDFDPTEFLGSRTWGDGSTDTIVWTWNRATGSDPTITFNSGSIGLQALTLTTDLAITDGGTGASSLTNLITLTTHTTGNYVASITDGLAIDGGDGGSEGATITIAFDPTELLGSRTWGDASTDTIVWTFDRATGTDPTITFNSGSIGLQALTLTADLAVTEGGTGASSLTNLITLTTHTTGNYSDGNAEGGDALVAIAVEITDNEATAENNPVVFVAGAAQTGGDLGLETDGTYFYTPSTGTLTTTEFVGGGAGVTAVDAITGDSATAFFDAGTIEHERGGLEADVAAFTGLLAIAGGATAEIDSKSELEGQIADVSDFAEADGDVFTGVHDFGGATSIEIVNATDPDVTVIGQISQDTDGGNETGDVSFRAYDGTNQFLITRRLKTLNFTLISPSNIDAKDFIPIWHNNTGFAFTIVEWKAWSNIDDVLLDIETATGIDYTARTTVDSVTIATNLTGVFFGEDTTITAGTIAADSTLAIDFGSTTPEYVQMAITGWFDANVD